MSSLSDRYRELICRFCINSRGGVCSKDVPYYAVSLSCRFFEDGEVIKLALDRESVLKLEDVLVDTL
jgi:hypothetical protein